jgi:putative sigma-54 modulation protein
MQIHLSPRNMKLTPSIHAYVAKRVEHLETITGEIIAAHVVVVLDHTEKPERKHQVKVHVAVPGPDLHADAHDADLYAAIDKVVDSLSRMVRKRKTRLVEKNRHARQRLAERRKIAG